MIKGNLDRTGNSSSLGSELKGASSFSRQQEEAQARRGGHPVFNDRITLDHRREDIDIGVSPLHWSRGYRLSHHQFALRHMRMWAADPACGSTALGAAAN